MVRSKLSQIFGTSTDEFTGYPEWRKIQGVPFEALEIGIGFSHPSLLLGKLSEQ